MSWFRWKQPKTSPLSRTEKLQLQLLRETRMAWADVKALVDDLKGKWAKVVEDLAAVHAKLDECMAKESVDPAELEAVKNDLVSVISNMDDHLHSDGM